jgi:hypothetical protein
MRRALEFTGVTISHSRHDVLLHLSSTNSVHGRARRERVRFAAAALIACRGKR